MKYVGSKRRIRKDIAPLITIHLNDHNKYIEPFVGGGNMIEFIDHHTKIGYDIDLRVIKALKFIRDNINEIPKNNKEFTEAMYDEMKQCRHDDPETLTGLQCYAGFNFSFGSLWYKSWSKNSRGTDYVKEVYDNMLITHDRLQGVSMNHGSYGMIKHSSGNVYYCDPPYAKTIEYNHKGFNHAEFWQWVRMLSVDNFVYVSEYNAPDDFKCIWEGEIVTKVNSKKTSIATEKLFTLTPEKGLFD